MAKTIETCFYCPNTSNEIDIILCHPAISMICKLCLELKIELMKDELRELKRAYKECFRG